MAVQVIEDACEFHPDMSRGTVVLESDVEGPNFSQAFHELDSIDTRSLAQSFAASRGLASPAINGNVVGPYPVNSKGVPLDAVRGSDGKPLAQTHPLMQPARYRLEVPLARLFR